MSRGGYLFPAARWGTKMGDTKAIDMVVGTLNDPFGGGHMGITAENVAKQSGISRAAQDGYALESHRRAAAAISAGYFRNQIILVELPSKKGVVLFDTDEHPRTDTSLENLAGLSIADIDVIESNEAFAAQPCAVS